MTLVEVYFICSLQHSHKDPQKIQWHKTNHHSNGLTSQFKKFSMPSHENLPIQENVREGGICAHIWHPLMHDNHDEGGEATNKQAIDNAEGRLPVLRI